MRNVLGKRPFHIGAWVVLPEYLHAIWTLPTGDDDYSSRWNHIIRNISADLLFDVIETGEIRHKSETELWIFNHYKEGPDNLVCVAVLLAKAVIVKPVL